MLDRLFGKKRSAASVSPEGTFWEWFVANSARYHSFDPLDEENREVLFDELAEQLERVNPGLVFEFGPSSDTRREFIISADGLKEIFPAVQKLVAAAPPLSNWEIIAFRPRGDVNCNVEYGSVALTPDEIYFLMEEYRGKIGLQLFFSNVENVNADELVAASFILLDNALGE